MTKVTSPHRWPAEWEPQAATWLAWPHNLDTWPGHFGPIPEVYSTWIRELARFQPVHVVTAPGRAGASAEQCLDGLANVSLHCWPTNDVWIRDYGPTFVKRLSDGHLVGVDWQYNAWGNKYPPYDDDARIAEKICLYLGCRRSRSPLFCEGGALETDGLGTLLTSTSCLLNASRNPGWTRPMVEEELMRQLGVSRVIWVDGGGLLGDDTDGHIDQIARFVAPGVVVAAVSSSEGDPNAAGLQQNLQILQRAQDAQGQALKVTPLPTPPPRFVGSQRVPESYCNFLFVNGAVILPTFRNPSTDRLAIDLFQQLLPDRQIIPLDAADLVFGLGAFHCASQQQPA
jgi:agmatine deiminase